MSCESDLKDGVIDDDPIAPMQIEHRCEEIYRAGALEQRYNYLLYTFIRGNVVITARAYLDTNDSVAMFSERLTNGDDIMVAETSAPDFWRDVICYLGRRYQTITALRAGKYEKP